MTARIGTLGGWFVAGSLAVLLSLGAASRASAADPKDDPAVAAYVTMETSVREHAKTKASEALISDIAEIMKARASVDVKLAAKYDALLAIIIDVQDEGVRRVCIKAMGDTKNPALARHFVRFLQQPDKGAQPPLMQESIEAMGKLAADEGVQPLMAILKDSKNYQVSAMALKAFSGYGESKRLRVGILRDVIATVSKDQPSVGMRYKNDDGQGPYATAKTRTGDETKARYEALSGVMVETLNKMTGQKCAAPEDWFAIWDNHKSKPADLFASK